MIIIWQFDKKHERHYGLDGKIDAKGIKDAVKSQYGLYSTEYKLVKSLKVEADFINMAMLSINMLPSLNIEY